MKKLLIKTGVLFLAFISVIAIYFISIYKDEDGEDIVMQSATLPVVSMIYEDTSINMLQGYTTYMDGR